jgi:hypothetical protein
MTKNNLENKILIFSVFLLISFIGTYLIGCGGGGSGIVRETPPPDSITIAWDAPIKRTDGSDLPGSEVAGYTVHYGLSSNQYTNSIIVNDSTTFTIGNLSPGTYYFAVKISDSFGYESDFSDEVSVTLE